VLVKRIFCFKEKKTLKTSTTVQSLVFFAVKPLKIHILDSVTAENHFL